MLALILFLATALPTQPPADEPESWTLELVIDAWDQRITLSVPADSYVECEELRDSWLVEGPKDREGWESKADCVEIKR